MEFDAKQIIGTEESPELDGTALGKAIAKSGVPMSEVVINVTNLVPEDLVSNFVNALLITIEKERADVETKDLAGISWKASYKSEQVRLDLATEGFVETAPLFEEKAAH